ncbi:MAG: FliH/SctL family protein [Pseudomonadota bacterium]|nr:FliH/SctL family protein [Pseudomonadota bacterium]
MSYLLTLHHDTALTLATTRAVVPAAELPALQGALALTEHLSTLIAGQQQALAKAEADARTRGEQAGHQAATARALQDNAQAIAATLADLAAQQAAQRDELREALLALATAMVRRMALDLAPEQVLAALAARAFEQVVPPQPVRLRLPPLLVEPVRAQLAQRELPLPVQCVADEQLGGLACRIDSAAGTLLAGLDDMLDRTAQRLALSRREQASAPAAPAPQETASP